MHKIAKQLVKKVISYVLTVIMLMVYYVPYMKVPEVKALNKVTLDVSKGQIEVYPTYYTIGGSTYTCSCSGTEYVITGSVSNGNRQVIFWNTSDTASKVTYNVIFRDLTLYAREWCSLVHFGGESHGTSSNLVVNLKLEGTNSITAHGVGLTGNACLNISTALTNTTIGGWYSYNNAAVDSNLVLNKDGAYEIKVGDNITTTLDAAKTNKPLVITKKQTDPICNPPTGITATCGQKLSDISLTNPSGNTAGNWTWESPNTFVENIGTKTFKATFTPTDTSSYYTKTGINVSVTAAETNIVINLGDAKIHGNANGLYYTFPESTITSEVSGLKIYSVIVSAMDKENPETLKSGVRIASSGSGLTADSNNIDNSQYYTSSSGISLSQAQSFVRGLKFYCSEDFNAKVQLSYSQLPSDVHYYPGTGHYYQIVNNGSAISWIDSYKAALGSNFRGVQGYLANITSEGENSFVWSKCNGTYTMVGGTRAQINNINTTSASTTGTNLNYFYWASGPELLYNPDTNSYGVSNPINSIFYNKIRHDDTSTNGKIIYSYSNWNSGQPDNCDDSGTGGALYVELVDWGNGLSWNDRNNNKVSSFCIEYGDRLYGNSKTISCMASAIKEVTMNLNVDLGNSQINDDGSTYYTFPSATVSCDTSDLKIYSIIVSAMDKEYPDELKSGARIIPTGSGLTADTNNTDNSQYYTSASGISLSQAQSFVCGLKFYCSEDFNAKVQLSYSQLPSDVHYYPGTGHYYQIVNNGSDISWLDAYKAALSSNFKGINGYLANITSEGEQNFIKYYCNNSNTWIGGVRNQINNINTTSAILTDTNLGYWYWASGPELLYNPNTKSYGNPSSTNSIFYNKSKCSDTTINGNRVYDYSSWTSGEPNGTECAHIWLFNGGNISGNWDDTTNEKTYKYAPASYAIEYGNRLYGTSETISCMASAIKEVTMNLNVDLGNSQINDDGSTYYTFPSATVTSDTSDLKIYSIIVSAMDKEYPDELKSDVRIVSTGSGMTADSNNTDNSQYYTSANGISLSQAQSFVCGLKFYCSEDFNAKVQLSYSQLPSDVHYYPGTGHYYRYVSSPNISWIDAYNTALSSNFKGQQGYLATITSQGENDFCIQYANNGTKSGAWTGGTSKLLNNMGTNSATLGNAVNYWYWACGPESKYSEGNYGNPNSYNGIFYNRRSCTNEASEVQIKYEYNKWNGGQPNDVGNIESFLAINSNYLVGGWDDFRDDGDNNYFQGYMLEYGDRLYGNSKDLDYMISDVKEVIIHIDVGIMTKPERNLSEISSGTVYDNDCTISTNNDGIETVKVVSGTYPGGIVTHVLEAVGGTFVRNQKFILADYSTNVQYYYYIVESDNLTQIPLTSFKQMKDKTTPWSEPASESCTDTLQFIVDFSDTNQSVEKQTQQLKLSYNYNGLEIGSGNITINFTDNGFYAEASQNDGNVLLKARGNGNKNVYAVAKLTDSNGNQMSFNSNQILRSNMGTFEIVRGGFAKLNLGQVANTLTNYSLSNVTLTGMPKMTYNILFYVCIAESGESDYPCLHSIGPATVTTSS